MLNILNPRQARGIDSILESFLAALSNPPPSQPFLAPRYSIQQLLTSTFVPFPFFYPRRSRQVLERLELLLLMLWREEHFVINM